MTRKGQGQSLWNVQQWIPIEMAQQVDNFPASPPKDGEKDGEKDEEVQIYSHSHQKFQSFHENLVQNIKTKNIRNFHHRNLLRKEISLLDSIQLEYGGRP